jgi:hypothetical protein
MVQKTTFGEKLELIANFGDEPFRSSETEVPAHTIRTRHLDSGQSADYPAKP